MRNQAARGSPIARMRFRLGDPRPRGGVRSNHTASTHLIDVEYTMNILALIIQLISGAVGGNIAGAVLKKLDLGTLGNSIAGILGGGLGGQLLSMLGIGTAAAGGAAASGLDLGTILSSIAGGGVGGGLLMAIVGAIKTAMAKKPAVG
jgi:hypothetical protein